jgi:hypothetical protein
LTTEAVIAPARSEARDAAVAATSSSVKRVRVTRDRLAVEHVELRNLAAATLAFDRAVLCFDCAVRDWRRAGMTRAAGLR